MVRPNREAIDTFISITGASESIAIQKLEEYRCDLNRAVDGYFNDGDRFRALETSTAARQEDDLMEIDDVDEIDQVFSRGPSFPVFPGPTRSDPFSLLEPHFRSTLLNGTSEFMTRAPFISHPREVREIPIDIIDESRPSSRNGIAPIIEEVTDTTRDHGPEIHGTVILDEDDDDNYVPARNALLRRRNETRHDWPSAPMVDDIEEEMIRAAIEASKQEAEQSQPIIIDDITTDTVQTHSRPEDPKLAQAVSLSLRTAELEKATQNQVEKVETSEPGFKKGAAVEEPWMFAPSNGRHRQWIGFGHKGSSSHSNVEVESSSTEEDVEELEEQPLVRQRTRRVASSTITPINEVGVSPPSSPRQHNPSIEQSDEDEFPSEWGGLSSQEHDEAIMLEAAMFGGIPEGSGYFANAPHPLMRSTLEGTLAPYARPTPRPPSPNLTAQRLIREQQNEEYLASLQADKEKEMKAIEEAEAHRLEELAAREAAFEEERREEDELRRKLEEEQEFERKLAAKEASLPSEPTSDDENAITLLVRMPDGSRRGRRFLRSDKLQLFFDFIDIGRVVKPGTYRLVRPYPRRAFGDGESDLTLSELGLTTKQEALYLELI